MGGPYWKSILSRSRKYSVEVSLSTRHHALGGHAFLVYMSFAIYVKIFIYLSANNDDIRPDDYSIYQSFNGSCCGNYLENYSSDLDFYTITTTNFTTRRSKARLIGGHIPYYANSVSSFRLLIICGDVELNPGPNSQN